MHYLQHVQSAADDTLQASPLRLTEYEATRMDEIHDDQQLIKVMLVEALGLLREKASLLSLVSQRRH